MNTINIFASSRGRRLALWVSLCALFVASATPNAAKQLTAPSQLVEYTLDGHLSPWVVAVLGSALLWTKRHHLWANMERNPSWPFVLLGAILLALSWYLSASTATTLGLLTGVVGGFSLFFGRAALAPLAALGAFALVLYYPDVVYTYLDSAYAGTVMGPVIWILSALRLPFAVSDLSILLHLESGRSIWLEVAAACAGPTTMALFLGLYLLMMLYRPLPTNKGLMMLLVGITGTWLQNVVRVTALMIIGHNIGESALWSAHEYLSYFLFPIWYMVFAVVYVSMAASSGEDTASGWPQGRAAIGAVIDEEQYKSRAYNQ